MPDIVAAPTPAGYNAPAQPVAQPISPSYAPAPSQWNNPNTQVAPPAAAPQSPSNWGNPPAPAAPQQPQGPPPANQSPWGGHFNNPGQPGAGAPGSAPTPISGYDPYGRPAAPQQPYPPPAAPPGWGQPVPAPAAPQAPPPGYQPYAQPVAPAQPQQPFSVREALAQQGFQFGSDAEAFQAIQQAQAQQYAEIQRLRAVHAQAAPPQANPAIVPPAAQPGYWNRPQFDRRTLDLVTRDAQGNLVPKDGVNYQAVQQVREYASWLNDKQESFWDDPVQSIKPGLEAVIAEQVKAQLGSYQAEVQQRQQLAAFQADAETWAYQKDQGGQKVLDATGRPVLSQAGQVYAHFVQEAHRVGIADIAAQDAYARRGTQAHLLSLRAQAAPPPAAPASPYGGSPTQGGFSQFATMQHNPPSYGGTLVNANPAAVPQPVAQNPHLTLGQQMQNALRFGRGSA